MESTGQRRGRPAGGDGNNRDRILAAARTEFARKAFRGTTMRSIAARAGVDIALLSHYFANKDGLFVATLQLPEGTPALLVTALSTPLETQGVQLARAYFELWENESTGAQMRILARTSLSNEAGSTRIKALLGGNIGDPRVAPLLAGREAGFLLAMSHLLGVAITRYLTQLPQLTDLDIDALVEQVAPAIQVHLSPRG